MREIGNPGNVTHTEPSATMISPGEFGTASSIVLETLLVFGSIRSTLLSFLQYVQIDASPTATSNGSAETSIRCVTTFRSGSIRSNRFSDGHATHKADSPNTMPVQPAGNRISATTLFSTGSMRDSVVFSSVKTQTLSDDVAMPPLTDAAPVLSVFTT